jgi:hypothetical protein
MRKHTLVVRCPDCRGRLEPVARTATYRCQKEGCDRVFDLGAKPPGAVRQSLTEELSDAEASPLPALAPACLTANPSPWA